MHFSTKEKHPKKQTILDSPVTDIPVCFLATD